MSERRGAALAAATLAAVLAAATAALSPAPQTVPLRARASAAHYREHHDFASLQQALPELWLGRPRAEIEALLGPPTYCPVPDEQCYYASDTRNSANVILTLVVEYRTWRPDAIDTTRTDRLESITLGPIAE